MLLIIIMVAGLSAPSAQAAGPTSLPDPLTGPLDPAPASRAQTAASSMVDLAGLGSASARGNALLTTAVTGAALTDSGAWLASRSSRPATIHRWDRADQVGAVVPLGTGTTSWSVLHLGDRMVVGTGQPASLQVRRPDTGQLVSRVDLAADEIVMSMDAGSDGLVAVGTYSPSAARLLLFNPNDASIRELGSWPGRRYVRAVLWVGSDLYASTGNPAGLVRWNTSGLADIDLGTLADESFIYSLATDGQSVYGGTEPNARGLVLKPGAGRVEGWDAGPGTTIDTMTVHDRRVYYTVRPSGQLRSVDADSLRDPSLLATPVPGAETRALRAGSTGVSGVSGLGELWTVRSPDQTVWYAAHSRLTKPDAVVQSLAAAGDEVFVAGHWRYQIHNVATGAQRDVAIVGEPKVSLVRDGVVFAATYPNAAVQRIDPGARSATLLASVGNDQVRPRAMVWHSRSATLLVSTRPAYGRYGGDLTTVDPRSGRIITQLVTPLGRHTVSSMVEWDADAVVGTETYGESVPSDPASGPAVLTRINPTTGAKRWSVVIDPQAVSINALTTVIVGRGRYLVAGTNTGWLAMVDGSGRVLWRKHLGAAISRLESSPDRLLAHLSSSLYELYPDLNSVSSRRVVGAARFALTADNRIALTTSDSVPQLWAGRFRAGPMSTRWGGTDAFQTAALVSEGLVARSETVVLANSDGWADALSVGPLAARLHAPLLLSPRTWLPPTTRQEIVRRGAKRVVLIGGTGAISPEVQAELTRMGLTVERLGGADRYQTCLAIAARIRRIDGRSTQPVFLVTGQDYPDGLVAAPAAAARGGVILLTAGSRLTAPVRKFMDAGRPAARYAVGGFAVQAAATARLPLTAAYSGADREQTALLVARAFFATSARAYLVNAWSFAPALPAVAAAGFERSPVLFATWGSLGRATAAHLARTRVRTVNVVGGPGQVGPAVLTTLRYTFW